MSCDVLVVPEDPANNGYILKPLAERVLAACGKPNARVEVLTNPKTRGYENAKALLRRQLFDRYRHKDLLLFLVDADGRDRGGEFQALEEDAHARGLKLLCCAAKEEIEIWLLAGYRDRLSAKWQEIRSEVDLKQRFFDAFLAKHGNPKAPGGGREELMRAALKSYGSLLQVCPELAELEQRIRAALA